MQSFKCNLEKDRALRKLGRLSKIGFLELDLEDYSLYWTDEACAIWGRKKTSGAGSWKEFLASIHTEDQQMYSDAHATFVANLKAFDVQYRIVLPNGVIKWIHERGEVLNDTHSNQLCRQSSVQDVSEYRHFRGSLIQKEPLYRAVTQKQTNYIVRTDLEGSFTYFNDKFLEDFGSRFEAKTIIGNNSLSSLKQYHQNKIIAVVKKCMNHPNRIFQVALKTSNTKSTLWNFSSVTNGEGALEEIHGFGVDISDRVHAEESLIESDARYQLACKASSDAIWDWESKTNRLFWGEGFSTLFALESGIFTSDRNKWESHLHPKDAAKTIKDINAVLEGTGNYWQAEYRFKKGDGNYAHVIDRGLIIRDDKNAIIRIVGALQDVTEKKKLELLLDKVTILSRIGSFEVDCISNTIYWSDMTKEIHEVAADFVPDLHTIFTFYKRGASRTTMEQLFRGSVKNNMPFDIEVQIVSAKGTERWVRVVAVPEFSQGKCLRIIGSFQDIDPMIKVKTELLKTNAEKEFILESIGDAFFALDYKGIITYWNKQSEKLLKFPRQKTLGKSIWEIFPQVLHSSFFTYYQKGVEEKESQHFEIFIDLMNRWFEVSAYPSAKGLSVYFKDISSRKETDSRLLKLNKNLQEYTQELVTANKNLEQFSFILSHNLRAPVANILGLIHLLNDQDYLPDERQNFLQEISNNVNRLDHIIIDLNTILQVKSALSLKKEFVNLEDLIRSIHMGIQHLVQKEQVQIFTRFEALPKFKTVRSYLHSIFFNLITNSIKYRRHDDAPVIQIHSEKSEEGIKLIYQDNGMGIDLAKKGKKIFGLYQRFHHHIEGKGMGLFMVKTQVEILGGKITVCSEVNQGTQFILEFKEENKTLMTRHEKEA